MTPFYKYLKPFSETTRTSLSMEWPGLWGPLGSRIIVGGIGVAKE